MFTAIYSYTILLKKCFLSHVNVVLWALPPIFPPAVLSHYHLDRETSPLLLPHLPLSPICFTCQFFFSHFFVCVSPHVLPSSLNSVVSQVVATALTVSQILFHITFIFKESLHFFAIAQQDFICLFH